MLSPLRRAAHWAALAGSSVFAVARAGAFAQTHAETASKTLSIVSTNDVHGRIAQLPLLGGYLHNLRALRAKTGGGVLLLDAGDIFQGTLESNSSEGAAMIRAYNALGYGAASLGNHEFDFGPVGPHATPQATAEDPRGALKARVRQAKFPFVNANLRDASGGPFPVPGVQRSVLLTVSGVSIGIVGGVTKDTLRTTHPGNTQGLTLLPLAEAISEQTKRLRKQGARVVIAVVHAGGECQKLSDPDDLSSCDDKAEVFELARALGPGSVDLIVAGHTHSGVAQRVNGIPIIEAFSNGRAFGRVDITVPSAAAAPLSVNIHAPKELCAETLDKPICAELTYESAKVVRDPRVLAAIDGDLKNAKLEREKSVGVTIVAQVDRASKTESPLNNLVADLMLRASPGADAAFNNGGGVRIALPVGPLKYGTLFEMFPFDNTFATLKLPASQLSAIFARNLSMDNGMLSLAGLRAAASCESGQLTVAFRDLQDKPVEPTRMLTVVTSDFLASKGDGILVGLPLAPDALTIRYDRLIRDAILDGMRSYPGARIDGRDKALFDPEHPRVSYPGSRPVKCAAL